MSRTSLRAAALAAALALPAACSSKTDGPTPTVTAVDPDLICTAQQDVTVTITGSGFSPVVRGGLTEDPWVEMPRVLLVSSATTVEVPPANVSLGNSNGTELIAIIPMGLAPPLGPDDPEVTYDLRVVNPNGNEGTLAAALTIVPPPLLVAVNPNTGAQGDVVSVTLTGTGFRDGMSVTLDSDPPVVCANVVVISSTSATCDLDLNGVAAGTYDVTVTNADGCSDTLPGAFTVYEPNLFTLLGIDPPFGCTCADTTVTIFSDGGFVSTPRVEMRPHGETTPVIQFRRVAFIDSDTLTAIVPGGAEVGDYDVIVRNPPTDGGIGTLENGFRVVANPVPSIDAIVPSRGDPTVSTGTDVSIYGENFRDPVKIELIDIDGNIDATIASVTPVSGTQIDTNFPTSGMTEGPYLVRVTNLDEDTYSTFSAFLVAAVGPSGNLHPFASQPTMDTGRRMLAGVGARDDDGNYYLYAIGGDTGAGGDVLDSVEVTQLSRFGELGPWRPVRNPLGTPRVGATAVKVPIFDPAGSPFVPAKTYLYVLGGHDDEGTVLDTVERAVVLSADHAPVVTADPSTAAGTLEAGTWYYKVSAVLDAGDPDNPGGETLASDEAIVTIGAEGSVALDWEPVVVNGTAAASYRIYRTDAVNGVSQTEHLIDTTTDTDYTDTGADAGTEDPLPPGAVGVWVLQANTMLEARWGHGAAVVADDSGDRFLFAVGGKDAVSGGFLDSVEYAAIDDADGSISAFGNDNTNPLAVPRAFFGLTVETPENVSGLGSGARFFAAGGVALTGATSSLEISDLTTGGGNAAWAPYGGSGNMQVRAGVMAVITSEKFFALGGASNAIDTVLSNILATGRDVPFLANGDIGSPFQSTAEGLLGARALGAVATGSGFIYFVGGTSDGSDALATTERTY